ncbi:protein FAR1-RELATED SEQUENCE 5-like [Telopea speciosissima]|uniref:protein FAR1-RELATED SEQUENCE 5-like n=1 Tax=Telopea speciosissima TaxID=54955 RepID=UPI001CC34459|nr:protein FAR1-RELATED SEQUENCE 5-like [Telopea speciosissima]
MRSQRQISNIVAHGIDLADDSDIRPNATFDLMGMQVGGSKNLGCTRKDLNNCLRTKRQRDLAFGECESLLAYFENQTKNNPSFTYSLQLDNGEQITNIFWTNPRMLIDYALFGDVVIFDTTFCINKEYIPFEIFARFNHHRGVTIFEVALLYDEMIPSFKWLFETFLETHGQKKPITIFTDQDAAMARTIGEVLPETWHRLCTWHIMQNGIKHLGNLMKHESSFLKELNKCIFQYENEEEFENAWKVLLDHYQLKNNSWLAQIYSIKHKWACCYMKYTFTLGVRSTQLSESINNDLKNYLRPTLDLVRFLKQFERVVEDKRTNELKAEFEARNTLPRTMGCNAPVLRQAGKVYTPYIFNECRRKHDLFLDCSVKDHTINDVFHQYIIGMVDEEGDFVEGEIAVLYKTHEQVLECSWREFETYGILCCHILKVLDVLEIKYIPKKYILRRWTRATKDILVEDSKGKEVMEDVQLSRTQHFRYLMPKYVKLINQASNTDAGFEMTNINADILGKEIATLIIACSTTKDSVQCSEAYRDLVLKKKKVGKVVAKDIRPSLKLRGSRRKLIKQLKAKPQLAWKHQKNHLKALLHQVFMAIGSLQGSTTTVGVDLSPGQEIGEAHGDRF